MGAILQRRTRTRAVRLLAAGLVALTVACDAPGRGPALWTVRDADSTLYLFGTVHVLPEGVRWRSKRVNAAFAAADTVWFETATDAAAAQEIATLTEKYGRNPPGVTLSALLDADQQARLSRVAGDLGVAPGRLDSARPWLAALQLSMTFLAKKGHAQSTGVESVLEGEARATGKRIAYLETAEQQLQVFANLSLGAEVAFLEATLRQIEEDGDQTEELDRLWAAGEADRLGALLRRLIDEAGPELSVALIDDRNARWADQIVDVLEGSGVDFVAVGAAHLVGETGTPALLAARGYQVTGP